MTTDLDATALEATLDSVLDASVAGVAVVADGLNLIVDVATAGGETYVLRAPRKLRDTAYMNDLETEYAVVRHLADTPVPAPEPVAYCDDGSALGDPFYVMTRLDGEPVPLGDDLPERFQQPAARRRLGHEVVDALSAVHGVETGPLDDRCDHVAPRTEVERNLDRLDAATAVLDVDLSRLRSVGERLLDAAPPNHETTLTHGDFRPGNLLFAGDETPSVAGVLDWETAALRDPLTDLGYLLLRWRDAGDATPDLDAIDSLDPDSDLCGDLRAANEHGLAPFTSKPGSPTRQELVARYEDRTGRSFDHERFYRATGAFGLATVWVDLRRHAVEAGTDADWTRRPSVEYVALLAERVLDGDVEL